MHPIEDFIYSTFLWQVTSTTTEREVVVIQDQSKMVTD